MTDKRQQQVSTPCVYPTATPLILLQWNGNCDTKSTLSILRIEKKKTLLGRDELVGCCDDRVCLMCVPFVSRRDVRVVSAALTEHRRRDARRVHRGQRALPVLVSEWTQQKGWDQAGQDQHQKVTSRVCLFTALNPISHTVKPHRLSLGEGEEMLSAYQKKPPRSN